MRAPVTKVWITWKLCGRKVKVLVEWMDLSLVDGAD